MHVQVAFYQQQLAEHHQIKMVSGHSGQPNLAQYNGRSDHSMDQEVWNLTVFNKMNSACQPSPFYCLLRCVDREKVPNTVSMWHCCLQACEAGHVGADILGQQSGPDFEAFIKAGVSAFGLELSPEAWELARADTAGNDSTAQAAGQAAAGGAALSMAS